MRKRTAEILKTLTITGDGPFMYERDRAAYGGFLSDITIECLEFRGGTSMPIACSARLWLCDRQLVAAATIEQYGDETNPGLWRDYSVELVRGESRYAEEIFDDWMLNHDWADDFISLAMVEPPERCPECGVELNCESWHYCFDEPDAITVWKDAVDYT